LCEGWQGSHNKEKKGIHVCTKEGQSWSKQELAANSGDKGEDGTGVVNQQDMV